MERPHHRPRDSAQATVWRPERGKREWLDYNAWTLTRRLFCPKVLLGWTSSKRVKSFTAQGPGDKRKARQSDLVRGKVRGNRGGGQEERYHADMPESPQRRFPRRPAHSLFHDLYTRRSVILAKVNIYLDMSNQLLKAQNAFLHHEAV